MVATLNFRVTQRVGFKKSLTEQVKGIIDDEILNATETLQKGSPVATGELQKKWDVEPSRFENGSVIVGKIVNNANAALFRVRGRAAGKMPPVSAIAAWLVAVGGDPKYAYPIARSIGKKGTRRYRSGDNVAKIDKSGNLQPNSPIAQAQRNISVRFKQIRI